jgi:RNA recognition motif-containing protein
MSLMNIYVGNLAYAVKESELETIFGEFGQVVSVKIVSDRDTGRSKGFGFVEMQDEADGETAIEALNGKEMSGRAVVVNKARPKPAGGGGGGGFRGGNRY